MISFDQNKLKKIAFEAGKVAVLMGGAGAERSISLESGNAVWKALIESGFDAEPVEWDGRSLAIFDSEKFQSFFIAVHGSGGEDGSIQAVLEIKGVPYTGSGILASALGMDKRKAKIIWRDKGLCTPEFVSLKENTPIEVVSQLGFPVVIKPPCQGSSIGVSLVNGEQDLAQSLKIARTYDSEVMVEKYIAGSEYTVPVLRNEPLPAVKIETDREFYDYSAKYKSNSTRYVCPSDLSGSKRREISDLALESYLALGCEGWGRVDFIQDFEGDFQLIEINTVPGMTSHSLVPMSAKSAGIGFDQLVVEILADGLEKRDRR